MKKFIISLLLCVPFLVQAQLPVGTIRRSVVTDTNGWFINNPIGFSNQVSMVVAPTNNNQLIRFQELTNSLFSATNSIRPIATGGTSTNTTRLVGSWTNSLNFTVSGTNNANAYAVKGQLGFSGSVTNLGPGLGSSNVMFFCDGIVTNKTTIP